MMRYSDALAQFKIWLATEATRDQRAAIHHYHQLYVYWKIEKEIEASSMYRAADIYEPGYWTDEEGLPHGV